MQGTVVKNNLWDDETCYRENEKNHVGEILVTVDHNPARHVTSLRGNTLRVSFILILGTILSVFFLTLRKSNEVTAEGSHYNYNSLPIKDRSRRQAGSCHVDMCLTKECIHAASEILQHMDTSVDPCEDFYQYTCGSWIKENKHKADLDELFYAVNHNTLPENVDSILSELLKQHIEIPEEMLDTKPYQNLFTFYESCIQVPELNNDMSEALEFLKTLKEFQIGRPFEPESWDLTKAVLELMRINGAPLLDVIIQSDVQKPEKYCINITPPRRYGLIPNLLGPKMRNPFVEE
ncbi:hypothetical protein SK128_015060, partial [Halocaridina rubra]